MGPVGAVWEPQRAPWSEQHMPKVLKGANRAPTTPNQHGNSPSAPITKQLCAQVVPKTSRVPKACAGDGDISLAPAQPPRAMTSGCWQRTWLTCWGAWGGEKPTPVMIHVDAKPALSLRKVPPHWEAAEEHPGLPSVTALLGWPRQAKCLAKTSVCP